MGRTSFTQELKELATASEGMDAGGCWREVLLLHRELGRTENALGRAAWTLATTSAASGGALVKSRNAQREDARSDHREASDHDDSGWAPDERGSEVRGAAGCEATATSGHGGAIDHSFDFGVLGEPALAGDDCPKGEPVGECPTCGWGVCACESGEGVVVAGAEVAGERGKCSSDLARALARDSGACQGDHPLVQAQWGRPPVQRPNELALAGGES
jgi:hypothetical protein